MGAEEIAGAKEINNLRNLVLDALKTGASDQQAIVEFIQNKHQEYSRADISKVVWSLILHDDIELKRGMRLEAATV
jgi:hypothetical protein